MLDDGSVRVASRLDPGTREFRGDDTAARFAAGEMPRRPARAFAADLDGDGRRDLLVWETASGRLLTLRNAPAADGTGLRFTPGSVARKLEGARQLDVGRFVDDRQDSLVWLERDGTLRCAGLKFEANGGAHLGDEATLCRAKADDHLAVGRFRGEAESDVIVGRRILPAGDPARGVELPALPVEDEARGDVGWMAADIDGNGRDDLIRKRATDDPGTGHDVVVHFASRGGDRLRGFVASDGDGLLDTWKTGAVRPGGLDLRALGCKPGRKDLILEIEWFENVDIDLLRAEVAITVNYFATLPVRNRDGSRGIALHALFRDPTPRAEYDDVVRRFDDRYPPRAHRGVVHTMFCGGPGDPGFGVAKLMGDNGRFSTNPQLQDVIVHELGHQLGLGHEGSQPHNSPLYLSTMSYCYQDGYNGRTDNKGYSVGSFGRGLLNERRLLERLPFPIERLSFLSGPPYHFALRPAGRSTLVDWNWNGVFGEENIVADINYSHGTDVGPRYEIGRTATAPALVTHAPGAGERLIAVFGRRPANAVRTAPDAPNAEAGPSPRRPGELVLRVWTGKDRDKDGARWSNEVVVEPAGVTGDPSAVFASGATWVACTTTGGVVLHRITLGAEGAATVGPALPIAASRGAQPTLAAIGSHLVLFLWRAPDAPVRFAHAERRGRHPRGWSRAGDGPPERGSRRRDPGRDASGRRDLLGVDNGGVGKR